jgi:predicted TIM-barrel fold metal-dependent hydrolase
MKGRKKISRRSTLKGMGALGAAAFLGACSTGGEESSVGSKDSDVGTSDVRKRIFEKVFATSFVDTHEHLSDESERLNGNYCREWGRGDDWSILFTVYADSDVRSAGISEKEYDEFFSSKVDPLKKWDFLSPYWGSMKNTGYGQAVRIAMKELYGVDELCAGTVKQVQAGYEKTCRSGFYRRILCDLAKIESCQVNSGDGFHESNMPELLMQDIGIVGMFSGLNFELAKPTGVKVSCLSDWHKVIDWWFGKYGKYAVAVKSQDAYSRNIDYEQVEAAKVEPIFKKRLAKETLNAEEKKTLEDHLFWYSVNKATESELPVKLHTGYYAKWGDNKARMPLSCVAKNPSSATDLCRKSPETRFVFMHICYPYYEEMITVAKHYPNAYIDMCWAWIINPVGSKDFLKKYLVTAPANKILTFGGDYGPVEAVLGHAVIARRGIGLALSELVEEGWLSLDDALEVTEPIMHGNARRIFNLNEKTKVLKSAW